MKKVYDTDSITPPEQFRIWHISWLCKALEVYRKKHNTIKGDITIGEFIKENCKDDFNKIVSME